MGSWGEGAFDNDEARHWLDGFLASGDRGMIESVLQLVCRARNAYLEIRDAQRAIAAAKLLTLAYETLEAGEEGDDEIPTDLAAWLKASGFSGNERLRILARRAINRVLTDPSELKDSWMDRGRLDQWAARLYELRASL